jgi:hypothetical protein
MSFTINRNSNFKPVKRNNPFSNSINSNSLKESLGSTGSTGFLVLDTLSLNNEQITASATNLNYLQVTPGIAEATKALVLNSSKNIANIGTITCSSYINVNGTYITSNADIITGPSDDLNNPYVISSIIGTAQASKILITDSGNNINNINKLSVNNLKIKDTKLVFNNINKIYHLENIKSQVYPSSVTTERLNSLTYTHVSGTETWYSSGQWSSICWSEELKIFVAVANVNSSFPFLNKIMVSNNGLEWKSYSNPYVNTGFNSICWCPELSLFIAVGTDAIIRSSDGINWVACYTSHNVTLTSVCWSQELNLFVAVGNTKTANRVLKSTDGIYWSAASGGNYSHSWSSVCWANTLNLFVAVANTGENIYRIMTSNDGNNWELIKHPRFNNCAFYSVIWSEELNMLVASNSTYGRIIRSYDGVNWQNCFSYEDSTPQWYYDSILSMIWIKELHMFVAPLGKKSKLYVSYNGINWRERAFSSTADFISMAWSPSIGLAMLNNNAGARVTLTGMVKTIQSGIISDNNSITTNQTNNYVGINTMTPNKPLEINSSTGACLKLTNGNNSASFNVENNGIFNITSNNKIYISTDFATYGLKLNDVLLLPTINEYNYLSNITNGSAAASKILITNDNNDINNINILSCNTLIKNGININDSNNNQYLVDIVPGIASPSKGLFTDSLKNIKNINEISTNSLNSNFDTIYGTNVSESINIYNLKNKNQINKKSLIVNSFNASNWNLITNASGNWNDICYSSELNVFVVIANSVIMTSNDGIIWTNTTPVRFPLSFNRICWSPKLNIFVVASSSNSDWSIAVSNNGYQWNQVDCVIPTSSKIELIWADELELFILILDQNPYRSYTSQNGLTWSENSLSLSHSWSSVCWANKLGLFIVCSSSSSMIATSNDGLTWSYIQINDPNTANGYNSIVWSPELNMAIAVKDSVSTYSYDGINWYTNRMPISSNNIIWCSSINVFITISPYTNLLYSIDGITWNIITAPSSDNWTRIKWVEELSIIMAVSTGGNAQRIAYLTIPGLNNNRSNLFSHKSQLFMDKLNGRLGIGTSVPNYQLELSTDSAGKPSTNTWTVASDIRLKENIENADLSICYNIIKNLKLKKYIWKDNIFNQYQIKDRSKLGWIADEVEIIFPKAVDIKNAYNLNNCKVLNIDQIINAMYGCTQKIIDDYDLIESDIVNINNSLNDIETFINELEL